MDRRGYELVNADLTLVAEKPKIAPYREGMEKMLAAALKAEPESISVKATTTEKLGFTGREEGIAAEAIVLLKVRQEE
jgi:2-C-methyl-D-erythritol 2,4-cyclodiphosphate synthase